MKSPCSITLCFICCRGFCIVTVGTEPSWTHFLSGRNIQLCDHITENGEVFAYNEVIKQRYNQTKQGGILNEIKG